MQNALNAKQMWIILEKCRIKMFITVANIPEIFGNIQEIITRKKFIIIPSETAHDHEHG